MRYGIFSDIHSNLEAFEAIIHAYKKEAIDKYLCAGDVVGYASNPKECIEKTKSLAAVTIAGNHDWASVGLFSLDYFNDIAKEAIIWTQRNLDDESRYFLQSLKLLYKNDDFTLVHSTLDEPQDFNYMGDGYIADKTFNLLETNLCFIGHTHVTGVFIKAPDSQIYYTKDESLELKEENKYIVNVGSIGQPRDLNPKSVYCIYDSEKRRIYIKRIEYDIEAARKKIFQVGLPTFLGNRLLIGR